MMKMKITSLRFILFGFAMFMLATPVYAQEVEKSAEQTSVYELSAHAAGPASIVTKGRVIPLWGVQHIDDASTLFKVEAQNALNNLIGKAPLECELISVAGEGIHAQCLNNARVDLAHYMLQNGYVVLSRAHIYGSVFEEPYLRASSQAREMNTGIWADGKTQDSQDNIALFNLIVALLILVVMIVVAIVLIRIVQQGFHKIIEAQQETLQNFNKEQVLREKEKHVVASMIRSEIEENKSKIEAYLTIYQEMLSDLRDPLKTPKYQTSGDIVQKQPALDRAIFDNNADKMELFERSMASKIVHFYARVKTTPEYLNIDSHVDRDEVAALIEQVVSHAQKLDEQAEMLSQAFSKYGFGEKR